MKHNTQNDAINLRMEENIPTRTLLASDGALVNGESGQIDEYALVEIGSARKEGTLLST